MKVFLIGYMGSGKSAIGEKLASALKLPFFDLDKLIEKAEELTVSQLFEKKGEEYFRKKETEVLMNVASLEKFVIACGGGTPCYHDHMDLMNGTGITVYLNYAPGMLASRLVKEKSSRPLIKEKSDEELVQFVKSHLAEREPVYRRAKIIVDGSRFKLSELIDRLVSYL